MREVRREWTSRDLGCTGTDLTRDTVRGSATSQRAANKRTSLMQVSAPTGMR